MKYKKFCFLTLNFKLYYSHGLSNQMILCNLNINTKQGQFIMHKVQLLSLTVLKLKLGN